MFVPNSVFLFVLWLAGFFHHFRGSSLKATNLTMLFHLVVSTSGSFVQCFPFQSTTITSDCSDGPALFCEPHTSPAITLDQKWVCAALRKHRLAQSVDVLNNCVRLELLAAMF